MGLFRADFFRSLAAGFVLGALGLVAVMGSTGGLTDTEIGRASCRERV